VESWLLPDSYYSHGPLLPPLAAFLLWRARPAWRTRPARPDPRAWWLLGAGLFVHLAAAALTIDSLSAASLVLTVPAAAWLALGRERMAGQWPALGLLLFALPLPMFVTGRVAFELKEFAVGLALALGNGLGLGARRDGPSLFVPGQAHPLQVEDPCGGLRSLLALVTLGYVVAMFFGSRRGLRPWLLLAAAVPIALAVNVLRIVGLCFSAKEWGIEAATTSAHDLLNVAEWVLALVLLLAVDRLVSRRGEAAP
jgi:exosortase